MAKKIISVHNSTDDKLVGFGRWSSEGSVGASIEPQFGAGNTLWIPNQSPFPPDPEIPNNSDCARWYDTHRMEVTLYEPDPQAARGVGKYIGNWSFWAD